MKETNIVKLVQLALSKLSTVRVFRNNTGMGWQGTVVTQTSESIMLRNHRPLHAGLVKGSSDLIGYKTVTITRDMVGQDVAVFVALELKTKTGRISKEQDNFLQAVHDAGGIAGIARSPEEAQKIIESRF